MAAKQIQPMDFAGNISENWARWRELMELVLAGPDADKWSDTQKAAQFLISIGQRGRDMVRSWISSKELHEADKMKTMELFKIFDIHCTPKKNTTIQRKLFYETKQKTGQTTDEWVMQLRLIAADCKFHDQDEMICDMLVLNSADKRVQEKLLEADHLDLSKAVKIATTHEINVEQMKLLSTHDIHYVDSRVDQQQIGRSRAPSTSNLTRRNQVQPRTGRMHDEKCNMCGRTHTTRQACPAEGRACNHCGKLNHFAVVCRSKPHDASADDSRPFDRVRRAHRAHQRHLQN